MRNRSILTIVAGLALLAALSGCANPASGQPENTPAGVTSAPPTATGLSPVETPSVAESPSAAAGTVQAGSTQVTGTVQAGATEATGTTPGGATGQPGTAEATGQPGTAEATTEPGTQAAPTAGGTSVAVEGSATPTAEAAVSTWPVLLDPEYAFELRYPSGWLISENDLAEEDAPQLRIYSLQPADWSEDYVPISVEVVRGSDADFAKKYPEAASGEISSQGAYTATVATTGGAQAGGATPEATPAATTAATPAATTASTEEAAAPAAPAGEKLYIFQNAQDPTLRVVIRDSISGVTARAQAHADMVSLAEQVVRSFRWGELATPEPTGTPSQ